MWRRAYTVCFVSIYLEDRNFWLSLLAFMKLRIWNRKLGVPKQKIQLVPDCFLLLAIALIQECKNEYQ